MKPLIAGLIMFLLGSFTTPKAYGQELGRSFLSPEFDTLQSSKKDNVFYSIQNLSYQMGNNPIHSGSRISPDGEVLYFFSHDWRDTLSINSQDVFYSEKTDDGWSEPIAIEELNNFSHNGVHFVSKDHQRMLLLGEYFKNNHSSDGVSMTSYNTNSKTWEEPVKQKIKGYKNHSFSSYYMNKEETVMLLAIENKNSFGAQDIFVSFKKKENKWTKPMNLGNTINTAGSEGTMSLSADGRTLYFSTNGRSDTLGGFDVYKSYRLLEDRWDLWSIPQNLGAPINTVYDDLYFHSVNSDSLIYLSRNYNDHLDMTHSDIFLIKKDIRKPQPCSNLIVNVTEFPDYSPAKSTIILEEENKEPLIIKGEDNYTFNNLKDNSSYKVRVERLGYLPFEQTVLTNCNFPEKTVAVNLKPRQKDISWTIENIVFAFDSDRLLEESKPALEVLVNVMQNEPSLRVEISGHTDSRGNDNYNLQLSEARSAAVVNYLVAAGIDKERLFSKGYGETKLKNDCQNGVNCSEQLHQLNRRVEFKIIEIDNRLDNF